MILLTEQKTLDINIDGDVTTTTYSPQTIDMVVKSSDYAPICNIKSFDQHIRKFSHNSSEIESGELRHTKVDEICIGNIITKKYINEFWTSKQRAASSLHEVSYRACFKPQLPRFFINRLTEEGDIVYDPFGGRGTTIIEATLAGRRGISNDINPLSQILAYPRLHIPKISDVEKRLRELDFDKTKKSEIELDMFYHPQTLGEIVSLKDYLNDQKINSTEDDIDKWIRMVATNRLTGHSPGFFSVYTLPPNQAVSQERQKKINIQRNQIPEYRDIKKLIIKKTRQLIKGISDLEIEKIKKYGTNGVFINSDARFTCEIPDNIVQLTVTSPPFLDIVQYSSDNWLRCWFNGLDSDEIGRKITMSRTVKQWAQIMGDVFKELYRITGAGGWVAFEVGEARKSSVHLDEIVAPLGINAGFTLFGILINDQKFTKTANIWGVNNNTGGTNTNRIVIFKKEV